MLENLVIDMRALGIKSIALELTDDGRVMAPLVDDRPTLPPDPEVEAEFQATAGQCAEPGCGEPSGGVLGGKLPHLCRKHAFAHMGIK